MFWIESKGYDRWHSHPQQFVIHKTTAVIRPYSLYEHGSIFIGSYKTLEAAKAKAERMAK